MGANTIAISHFIDFRMRIDYSQRVGQYILKCKCTKKKGANATVCGKKVECRVLFRVFIDIAKVPLLNGEPLCMGTFRGGQRCELRDIFLIFLHVLSLLFCVLDLSE